MGWDDHNEFNGDRRSYQEDIPNQSADKINGIRFPFREERTNEGKDYEKYNSFIYRIGSPSPQLLDQPHTITSLPRRGDIFTGRP